MKQDEILTRKFKGKYSLGRPRLRREFGITVDLTEMWCDGEMGMSRLLCTVRYLHLDTVSLKAL